MSTVEASQPTVTPPKPTFRPGVRLIRNPVVLKELRGRMRGMRAFAVLTVYLTLMSGFVTLLYVLYASALAYNGFASGGQIGRVLFLGIVGTELFLVTFIAPTFTAGSISGERERQTYDLLRTTLLPARSLVVGKLFSALSYVFLLLLAAIPLQSIAFLFGGVTEIEVILAFIILVVTSITLGSVGIYFSAHMPRTLSASIMTYGVALLVTLGLPLLAFVVIPLLLSLLSSMTPSSPVLNTIMADIMGILVSSNPLATAVVTETTVVNNPQSGILAPMPFPIGGGTFYFMPPWIAFTIIYLLVSLLLVALSIRRVRRIEAS